MSNPINSEIYEKILDDEGFINDCWNKYGMTDKIATLKLSGWTDEMFLEEYARVVGSAEEHNEELEI